MKRLILGLLVAVVVGCLPPPPTVPPTHTPEPTATPLPTATPTFSPTVAPGRTPSPTPTVGRLRWVIREAELNEAVVKALTNADTGSLGFRDPRIDLQPGQ
ncbi:MAG: hypothetical protein NZP34_14095, partial [Caldilineales bacterium]|nr:hypothetical protein [Caldilineales bacterium]